NRVPTAGAGFVSIVLSTVLSSWGTRGDRAVSIDKQIETLERLAAIDAVIKELTAGKDKWQGELDGVRQELEALDARLAADRESIADMEKTRGDCIQEIRNVAGQIDR